MFRGGPEEGLTPPGRYAHAHQRLKSQGNCADSSTVNHTIPFIAAAAESETRATLADLVVDPQRCEGAVIFHRNRRVMALPAGRPAILARSRAKERAMTELYLPPGPTN